MRALERGVLDGVPTAVACFAGTEVMAANAEWKALVERSEGAAPAGAWLRAFDPRDRDSIANCLHAADGDIDVRLVDARRDQRWVRIRTAPLDERSSSVVVMTIASTGLGAAREALLVHRASHDEMTGLANRASFVASTTGRLDTATESVGLLFIDLDNFKQVNDRLGHRFGDALLQAVAQRIQSVVRDGDLAGRIGGDEIAVVCSPTESRHDAVRLAERIIEAVEEPFTLDGDTVIAEASIGIAFTGSAHVSATELIDAADRAMYVAKAAGGAQWALAESLPVRPISSHVRGADDGVGAGALEHIAPPLRGQDC